MTGLHAKGCRAMQRTTQHNPDLKACFLIYLVTLGRFFYIGHHILGLSHVMSQTNEASGNPLRCILLQASGNIRILTVPFHCALRYGHRAYGDRICAIENINLKWNLISLSRALLIRHLGDFCEFLTM